MKVVAISYDDYSNYGYAQIQSLKSVGVDAEGYKLITHPFGYTEQSAVVKKDVMREKIRDADIVLIMHSWVDGLTMCLELGKKKIIVYHTGTIYRNNPEKINRIFNAYVSVAMTDECEFIGTGMKNEQYIATAVDTDKIKFVDKEIKLPYIIAHYPSNAEVKGTDEMDKMFRKMFYTITPNSYRTTEWMAENATRFDLRMSKEKVSHEAQLKRISECDIYIEMFKPELHGKPYGCWGVTAFEAAAMGKIVITNNINLKAYTDVYIEAALMIANTEDEFIDTIKEVVSISPEEIKSYQQQVRTWVENSHSYPATGMRLKNILEKL